MTVMTDTAHCSWAAVIIRVAAVALAQDRERTSASPIRGISTSATDGEREQDGGQGGIGGHFMRHLGG